MCAGMVWEDTSLYGKSGDVMSVIWLIRNRVVVHCGSMSMERSVLLRQIQVSFDSTPKELQKK